MKGAENEVIAWKKIVVLIFMSQEDSLNLHTDSFELYAAHCKPLQPVCE